MSTSEHTDGLIVRPVRAADRQALADAYERLSDDSRYMRFLSHREGLTDSELRYLIEVDHHHHEAPRTGAGAESPTSCCASSASGPAEPGSGGSRGGRCRTTAPRSSWCERVEGRSLPSTAAPSASSST